MGKAGLKPCPICQRHVREDQACPFCEKSGAPRAGVIAATLLAAGCGGSPKPAEKPVGTPAATVDAGTPAPAADATDTPPQPVDPGGGGQMRPLYGVDRP